MKMDIFPMPKEEAFRLCIEIKQINQGRWYTLDFWQCWRCIALNGSNPEMMRFNVRPENRGCGLINSRHLKLKEKVKRQDASRDSPFFCDQTYEIIFMMKRWKERAEMLKAETFALYLAYRHPEVPWYAKLLTAIVVGYALSPIDLIPDFIPVVGYLDDLVIVPLGIAAVLKMIPAEVMEVCRLEAKEKMRGAKPNRVAAAIIVSIWLVFPLVIYLKFR